MFKRFVVGAIIVGAITGIQAGEPDARRPIHWKVGEYQRGGFDARPGDTITVFFAKRDTEANVVKCHDMGGAGIILVRWRGRLWEACPRVDF